MILNILTDAGLGTVPSNAFLSSSNLATIDLTEIVTQITALNTRTELMHILGIYGVNLPPGEITRDN